MLVYVDNTDLRVTQRDKRKAILKGESYDSSGLILQNKYLFRTKLADRGEEKQREKNFINNTLSVVKLEGRKLFSSTSCHDDRQIRFVLRFLLFLSHRLDLTILNCNLGKNCEVYGLLYLSFIPWVSLLIIVNKQK